MNTLSTEETKSYFGADVGKLYFEDGLYTCTMVYNTYVEKNTKNLKKKFDTDGFIFNNNLSYVNYSPKHQLLKTSFCPELDTSFECL